MRSIWFHGPVAKTADVAKKNSRMNDHSMDIG